MKTFTNTLTTYSCTGQQIDLIVPRHTCDYSEQFQDDRHSPFCGLNYKTNLGNNSLPHSIKSE